MRIWITGLIVLFLTAPLGAEEAKPAKPFSIPYRLTDSHHISVRAKINGKGPYNFIVDTGAPALFVATAVSKKLGVEADKDGWGTFERFEIEGGAVVEKARGRIADPFQLEGMNNLGLAGVRLDGVIGYNLLARYKVGLDLTKDKMTWTPLNFKPPEPEALGEEGGAEGVEALGKLLQFAMQLLVGKANTEVKPRGFLGMELAEKEGTLVVQAVLSKGPAATGGLQVGDRITQFQDRKKPSQTEVLRHMNKLAEGEKVKLTVQRGQETQEITLEAGKGL